MCNRLLFIYECVTVIRGKRKKLMIIKKLSIAIFALAMVSCNFKKKNNNSINKSTYSDVKIVGAMKNVMWKGELGSRIDLDTISDKNGLYGIGPKTYLTGELLINNGRNYLSKVTSDSTMTVEKRFDVSAPFLVYAHVTEWNEMDLPSSIKSIQDLEKFINKKTIEYKRPFAFKLKGQILKAIIHIQNLPKETKVSSPEEAHQGQVKYNISNEDVEIIGFFSTEHKGVFTHHDSFLHMHLITKDETKMGHLDEIDIKEMKLYLPKK